MWQRTEERKRKGWLTNVMEKGTPCEDKKIGKGTAEYRQQVKEQLYTDSREVKEQLYADSREVKEQLYTDSREVKEQLYTDSREVKEQLAQTGERKKNSW